jgi:hypothetical protein
VEVLRRTGDELGAPFGPSVAFASEDDLIGWAYGDEKTARPDRIWSARWQEAGLRILGESKSAFELGDVVCLSPCYARCWIADAGRGALRRMELGADWQELAASKADERIGLPPRSTLAF